jgi:hypothetical protein
MISDWPSEDSEALPVPVPAGGSHGAGPVARAGARLTRTLPGQHQTEPSRLPAAQEAFVLAAETQTCYFLPSISLSQHASASAAAATVEKGIFDGSSSDPSFFWWFKNCAHSPLSLRKKQGEVERPRDTPAQVDSAIKASTSVTASRTVLETLEGLQLRTRICQLATDSQTVRTAHCFVAVPCGAASLSSPFSL